MVQEKVRCTRYGASFAGNLVVKRNPVRLVCQLTVSTALSCVTAMVLGAASVGAAGLDQPLNLNQQLDIQINNGTRSTTRNDADKLLELGKIQELDGFPVEAVQSWQQALKIYQSLGDLDAESQVYDNLGRVYLQLGQYVAAEDAVRRQLAIARDRQDFQGQIYALNSLSRVLAGRGGIRDANILLTEALQISTSTSSRTGLALTQNSLGMLAFGTGNYPLAIERYRAALSASRQAGNLVLEATALNNLGELYQTAQDYRNSINYYGLAVRLTRISRDRLNQYRAIDGTVAALNATGNRNQSFELLGERLAMAQGQENSRQELISLQAIGQLHQEAGNYPKAQQFYEQAIVVAQDLADTRQENILRSKLVSLTRNPQ